MKRCLPGVLVIKETKISFDLKTNTYFVNNYQKPIHCDRNEFGGGIMQCVRKGIVGNRIPVLETPSLNLICSELIESKQKWIFNSIYQLNES